MKNICVFVVQYDVGVRLGPRKVAIENYMFKAKQSRSRPFRVTSHKSITSVVSALSFHRKTEEENYYVLAAQLEDEDGAVGGQPVLEQPEN